ncbi:glycosyltransferase [Solemya elarraichensis gill symbiont]|uniref:Glycosyltransferase n=1 Tax=Solemya elarraichensis gill symbiont TaxID=1918949 RepID=A0A1T2KTB0_9GAMM|nr:glycosyltransferase [Solemya elarraichensis gill symbiont]OOZ36031.1 glycosyltransferase [Solemya elarraichensis gill symbiont]
MKWGDKYHSEDVNRLFSMVARNLTFPFRFACFTDNWQGIREEVEIKPIPLLDLPSGLPERGWQKLSMFTSPLEDIQGITLFLGLDVEVIGNIDCFFEVEGEFLIAFDAKKRGKIIGNSSVYRFEAGKHPDILEYFQENFETVRKRFRNEQAYLSSKMNEKGIFKFWPKPWCPSFKYHCIPSFPLNFITPPVKPDGAKIILFHGEPNSDQAAKGVSGKWYRYFKPVSWISDR